MLIKPHNVFDVFNSPALTEGPFQQLADDLDQDSPQWLTDNCWYMDQMYIQHHATAKRISLFVERVITSAPSHPSPDREDVFVLTSAGVSWIMAQFWAEYGSNIEKIVSVLTDNYKPLDNYNMKEKRTPNLTDTTNVATNVTTSGSNSVYGFNSATAVPASDQTATTTGLATANQQTLKKTGSEDLERSGNIGVTTTQQMLLSELDLRENNDIEDYIFRLLDRVFTCGAYTHGVTNFEIIT